MAKFYFGIQRDMPYGEIFLFELKELQELLDQLRSIVTDNHQLFCTQSVIPKEKSDFVQTTERIINNLKKYTKDCKINLQEEGDR